MLHQFKIPTILPGFNDFSNDAKMIQDIYPVNSKLTLFNTSGKVF